MTKGTSRAGKPRKSASKAPPKAGARAKPGASEAKPVKLLSGGNPQIARADGDAPVQAYLAAMPGWKRDLGRRLDALIARNVPDVRKAVKWNSPFYGVEGQGWFLGLHTFTRHVKVAFGQAAKQEVPFEQLVLVEVNRRFEQRHIFLVLRRDVVALDGLHQTGLWIVVPQRRSDAVAGSVLGRVRSVSDHVKQRGFSQRTLSRSPPLTFDDVRAVSSPFVSC